RYIMRPRFPLSSRPVARTVHRSNPTTKLSLTPLEDRTVPAAPAPGFGPLPSVTVSLTPAQVDRADVVIDWNATMLRALWTAAAPPTLSSRAEAILGAAVYDAAEGVDPRYDLYPVP